MKRSLIWTGSRLVVPVPGLSSMRTPIRVGADADIDCSTSRSKSSSSAAQALLVMPLAMAMATRSVCAAAGVGCAPVIWYMPLSISTMVRFFGASVAMVESAPSCINSEPSPSSANTRRCGCASATPSAIGKASPMLPSMYQFCGRLPAAHKSKLVLPMPPITASSFFSFATRREVRSKRFITLVLRAGCAACVVMPLASFVKDLAAGEQRREDQGHRRLRGDGLLHRERIQHGTHGAAHQRLAVVELAQRAALGYQHDQRDLVGHCERGQHIG